MTPEAEARYALNFNIARSGLSMPAQLAYDQLLRDGYGGSKEEEEPDAVFPGVSAMFAVTCPGRNVNSRAG